jgi:HD-GYP domain-containing protein (c-di-GMP phosphodiesterase class II)
MTMLARTLGRHLGAIARASRVHDVGNHAVARLVTWFADDLEKLRAIGEGEARFELDGGVVVVNGVSARLSREIRGQLQLFWEALRRHETGGVRVSGSVNAYSLTTFFRGVREHPPGPRAELQAWLERNGAGALQLIPPKSLTAGVVGGGGDAVRAAATDALRAYIRAVVALQDAQNAHTLDRLPPAVYRALQNLAELAEEDPVHHVALTALKEDIDFELRHPVHAVVFALAMGVRIGLERNPLMELGFATMLAATLPEYPDDHEILAMSGSMVHSARLNNARARRMLVVAEAFGGIDRKGPPRLKLAGPPHLYSRIAAIAIEFDALTTRGETRRGLLADEALGEMGRRDVFDPELLRIFAAVVGRYPLGSGVMLTTGEVGVVFHTPADPAMATRPIVRIVVDGRSRVIRGGPLVDLSDPGETRRISGPIDLASMGVDGHRALFG